MGEFKPITTQEEFEARLTERLEQKQRSVEKRFEDEEAEEFTLDNSIPAIGEKKTSKRGRKPKAVK